MTTYVTLDVLSNKFPCEGPKVIPIFCDFSSATKYDVDLKSLVQQGKISDVQSIFVDNADNSGICTIDIDVQQQRIIIPPFSQAYLNVLTALPSFHVTSGTTALVRLFAQNFPVTNAVWNAGVGSGLASDVNVLNFPTSQGVNFSSGISNSFLPTFTGINLVTGAASANVAIVTAVGQNIRVFNAGTFPVSFRYGTGAQVAVVTDLTLAPNQSILVNSNGANNLAAISPGGAGSINIVVGNGGLSA